jgi:hypothetical protein
VSADNVAIGDLAMGANTNGAFNVAVGNSALAANVQGLFNVAVGSDALRDSVANANVAVGREALLTTTGFGNVGVGWQAGAGNMAGGSNTFVGRGTAAGAPGLTNATAIGSQSIVSQNNSLVLGSIAGLNGAAANALVGIGTAAPQDRLHVVGNVRVEGAVRRPSTGTSTNVVPVAYGFVLSTAELHTGTANVTVSYSDALGCYNVDVGEDVTGGTVIVSVNRADPYLATYILSSLTSFCARVYNLAGNPVPSNFSFVVYRP